MFDHLRLGHLVFAVRDLPRWRRFLEDFLGLPAAGTNPDGSIGYRVDGQAQRLILRQGSGRPRGARLGGERRIGLVGDRGRRQGGGERARRGRRGRSCRPPRGETRPVRRSRRQRERDRDRSGAVIVAIPVRALPSGFRTGEWDWATPCSWRVIGR